MSNRKVQKGAHMRINSTIIILLASISLSAFAIVIPSQDRVNKGQRERDEWEKENGKRKRRGIANQASSRPASSSRAKKAILEDE